MRDGSPTVVDIPALADRVGAEWANFEVAEVNDHVIRCSVLSRDFHWHTHQASDEAFLVIEGTLCIDLEHATLELGPAQMVTIPRGMRHRTRADGRVVNLTFELKGTEVTGDRPRGETG